MIVNDESEDNKSGHAGNDGQKSLDLWWLSPDPCGDGVDRSFLRSHGEKGFLLSARKHKRTQHKTKIVLLGPKLQPWNKQLEGSIDLREEDRTKTPKEHNETHTNKQIVQLC